METIQTEDPEETSDGHGQEGRLSQRQWKGTRALKPASLGAWGGRRGRTLRRPEARPTCPHPEPDPLPGAPFTPTDWKADPEGGHSSFCGFVVGQSLSRARLFATPWAAARQASLPITISRSLLTLTSIELMMPSNSSTVPDVVSLIPSGPHSLPGQSAFLCDNYLVTQSTSL